MKLGTTLTPASASNDEILDLIDFFEVPGWYDFDSSQLNFSVDLLLHNLDLDWTLASETAIDSLWSRRLQTALQHTRSAWFSLHLGFSSEQVYFDDHMHPIGQPLSRSALLDRFIVNLNLATATCPVPLLVENLDYCPEGAYEHICEPEFINSILGAVDCGLLLDIGHLQVSASWLNISPETCLELLPLDRVIEVHLSSPRPHYPDTTKLNDVHEELTGRDIELLELVLSHSNPKALTLEYQRDSGKLVEQLKSLRLLLE